MNHAHNVTGVSVFGLAITLGLAITTSTPCHAAAPGPSGYYVTGSVRRLDPDGNNYVLVHEMKALPAEPTQRSAQAVRNADVSKRFVLTFLRDVPCARVKSSLRLGLQRNGFSGAADQAKATPLVDACSAPIVKARSQVIIAYDARTQTTSIWVEGMGTGTARGVDTMRAVWGVWLGNVEKPKTDTSLVARL